MQFFVLARRRTEAFTEDQFAELLGPEADRVRALYAQGTIRAAYSRGDVTGAVLILECGNLEEAEAAVATLPLAAKGMLETQIIPVRGYRGFS